MKILHVTNHFHPCKGGIEKYVMDLSRHLNTKGYNSDVLCLNKCPDGRLLNPYSRVGKTRIFRIPFKDMKYYKIASGIRDKIRNYDVVHVHGLGYFFDFLTLAKVIHKKKIVLSTHGGFFHTKNLSYLKKVHFRTLTKLSMSKVDKVVAVSPQDALMFSKISNKVEHIPNGIDFNSFNSGKKDKSTFVYVGRLSSNKRIDNLIETFSQLSLKTKKFKLFIVGIDFDNILPQIRKKIDEKGLADNIILELNVSDKKKNSIMSKSQFFVSASEYEGFGISVVEGMASGCVPIVNDIDAFRNIVGLNGFLIDFSDHLKSAKQIEEIMNSSQSGLMNSCLREAKKYDWRNIIGKWSDVYG